jgi:hypothetical protein
MKLLENYKFMYINKIFKKKNLIISIECPQRYIIIKLVDIIIVGMK